MSRFEFAALVLLWAFTLGLLFSLTMEASR